MLRPSLIVRNAVVALFVVLCPLCAVRPVRAADGPLAPVNLRCEYLKNPVGIDVRQPRLSWVDRHTDRAQVQTAYQVLVASSPE
jgi:alpha-L-rhamnosidase